MGHHEDMEIFNLSFLRKKESIVGTGFRVKHGMTFKSLIRVDEWLSLKEQTT